MERATTGDPKKICLPGVIPFSIDMPHDYHPVPNAFTMTPMIHVMVEGYDGETRAYDLPLHIFQEWQQKHGGDPDWLDTWEGD